MSQQETSPCHSESTAHCPAGPQSGWPALQLPLTAEGLKTACSKPSLALTLSLILLIAAFVIGGQAAPPVQRLARPANPILHPLANTHNSPSGTTISITYDEPIDPMTVSTRTFAVHAMQTGLLAQTYSVSNGTIRLTPTQSLMPGEIVQVSATTGTLGLVDDQGPSHPTVWHFRAGVPGGSGAYAASAQSPGSLEGTPAVALGDLDRDGDLDAFLGNDNGQPNEVWLNEGTGILRSSGQSLGHATSQGVALGDLDGDGDLDAFVANALEACKVWLNDGGGAFTDSGQSLPNAENGAWATKVALADLDGDADLDAFTTHEGPNRVWLNDGAGRFADSGQRLRAGSSGGYGLALGDVDGDGDIDAFVADGDFGAGGGRANTVWLNDGSGAFVDSGQRLGQADSSDIALGDLDGDGDLDAFVANNNWAGAGTSKVWLNDGAGIFHASGQSLDGLDCDAVALGDVDGDGDLDAFAGNDGLLLNDGTAVFSDSGQSLGTTHTMDLAMGDIDGDGDLDAFITNYGANQVWKNLSLVVLPLVVSSYSPSTTHFWTGQVTNQFQNCFLTRVFGYTLDSNGGLVGGVWVHYWADGWDGAWAKSLWYGFGAGTPWTGDEGNWDGVIDNWPRDGTWHVCVVPGEGSWGCTSSTVDVTTSSDCENGYQIYHITFRHE